MIKSGKSREYIGMNQREVWSSPYQTKVKVWSDSANL